MNILPGNRSVSSTEPIERKSSSVADFLVRQPFLVSAVDTGIGAFSLTALSWQHSKEIRGTTALKSTEAYSQSVSAMRAFSSEHVVSRAKNAGATVSRDYKNSDTTIPFPATLSIELAKELRRSCSAFTFNFYSADPYPWGRERILDGFERDALKALDGTGTEKFVRYEKFNGQRSVRAAYPVVMRETFVAVSQSSSTEAPDRPEDRRHTRGSTDYPSACRCRGVIPAGHQGIGVLYRYLRPDRRDPDPDTDAWPKRTDRSDAQTCR